MPQELDTENDQRFRALIEHSSDAIALLTTEGIITYASPSSERVTGYQIDVLVGMNAFTLLHPGDRATIQQQFKTLLPKRGHSNTGEYRIWHKNGGWFWIEGTATNLLHDPPIRSVVINFRDVNERHQLEDRLRYSELKLRSLVESNILGVAVSDFTGRVHEVNDRFAQLVGYSREELLSGAVTKDQLIPEEYREAIAIHEAILLETGRMPPWEKECLRKDGTRVPTLMAGTLIDREQGRALVLFHDISDRKEAERRKQEFLSMVSHELRTPLTAVMGLVDLALLQIDQIPGKLSPEAEKLLGQAERMLKLALGEVDTEARMVEDLLTASRMDMHQFELSFQPKNLVTLVQEVVANQQQVSVSRQIELILPLDMIVSVSIDALRIGQVLTNYLTNALKYAPADQAISVCLEVTATTARVAVSDRGPGLTEQQQQRVWERFYRAVLPRHQSAATGLGLGLAIAKAIIEQHQGEVGVESVPGQGSTFWFTLPLATEVVQA
jgi:hypothetical protein